MKLAGGAAVRTTEEHLEGLVTKVAPDSLQEVALDIKVDKLAQNDVSVSDIEDTLKVDKGHHTVLREARVKINKAVVTPSSPGDEALPLKRAWRNSPSVIGTPSSSSGCSKVDIRRSYLTGA
ncbi:hypothetical protein E2C01_021909 [Portunus trituberculatus]|uniref:Uncharacterized protein n=1 Tax=Portunus trituberculatus TaxID=210409 RepID=A0A5B7E5L5_PORTR|nr:hypothetical protein [Portunus trituberculatus]